MTEFKIKVLEAVRDLKDNAYGKTVRQAVARATEKEIAIGEIYATLDSLEREGFVRSHQGEATKERGGRRKRYFKLEERGRRALIEIDTADRRAVGLLDDPLSA